MKSYTDLEQSKKLAEILPIESADMAWCNNSIKEINYTDKYSANLYTVKEMKDAFDKALVGWDKYWELIPCWSLAALLNILPVSCDDEQHCLALINHNPNEKTEWLCAYEDDKGNLMMECYADNQIDACVAMIDKLHEQNLL